LASDLRRLNRQVHEGADGVTSNSFVYDGLDMIAKIDEISGDIVCFTRGLGIAPGVGDVVGETHILAGSTQTFLYVQNHRGDTVALVDESGNVVGTYAYDAWGNITSHTGKDACLTFSTKHFDENAGLYYYGFRWYDPAAKRWTQPDPEGLSEGLDLYQFCGNDPINCVDVYGMFTWGDIVDGARSAAAYSAWVANKVHGVVDIFKEQGSIYTRSDAINTALDGFNRTMTDLNPLVMMLNGLASQLNAPQLFFDRYDHQICQGANPWEAGIMATDLAVGDFLIYTALLEAFKQCDYTGQHQTWDQRLSKGIAAVSQSLLLGAAKLQEAQLANRSLGYNPFQGMTATEIDTYLRNRGYRPMGNNPLVGKGNYVTKQGRYIHIDAEHPPGKPPHVGVYRPKKMRQLPPREYPL
jgi:RHS repeat-associated protein